jgi:response regulator NasT
LRVVDVFSGTARCATVQVQHFVDCLVVRAYDQAVQPSLKILVVEPEPAKAREIIDALKDGGWTDVTVIATPAALVRMMKDQEPDIVLIDLANPDRDTLEHLSLVSDAKSRPVAMFVDQSDEAMTQAAISAGLSAYVVNGLQKDRIKPVLETAIARFNVFQKMQSELDAAKRALSDRKTIDRAKGLLMRAKGISEDDAYNLLRKTAMDQGRKVIHVATALVTAAELLQ